MLRKFDVTNRRGNVLSFSMVEDDGGYQVAEIDGLGPVKATIVSSSFPGADDEIYQSAKRGARNIKIKVDLDPDFSPDTYTTLRQRLYSYLMPKSFVTLRFFMTSGLYVDIVGIVEDLSTPLFDEDPQVDISIMCHKSDFLDPRVITVEGLTVDDNTWTEVVYPGSVESGTVITMNVNRSVPAFTIYKRDDSGTIAQLDFSGDLQNGDTLVVSSLRGNKGITHTRAGVSKSYLYGMSAQSKWIEFAEGANEFRIYAPGDPVPYDLEYVVRYGAL